MSTFEIGPEDFLLDGERIQVVSGALHYFRVHPYLWADRIHKARLMGLNTIETYVPWNFHAPEPGVFDLDGRRDLGRFLDLVAAEGLHAIVRPGPYICAEWDGGGLPAWLLADPSVGVRRHEPAFLDAISKYYASLLPLVAERQVTRGGPVLMVQVENEYGADADAPLPERQKYLRALVDLVRAQGVEVPLFTCDQANDEMLERGGLPELHKMATFGSRTTERFEVLRRHQPTGPLMCMEFWNGWFDSWGLEHHLAPAEATPPTWTTCSRPAAPSTCTCSTAAPTSGSPAAPTTRASTGPSRRRTTTTRPSPRTVPLPRSTGRCVTSSRGTCRLSRPRSWAGVRRRRRFSTKSSPRT